MTGQCRLSLASACRAACPTSFGVARCTAPQHTTASPQETHSIFSVDLGNLEAHTEATVRLSYLRQLDRVAGALEYCHTATWVPPYAGSAGDRADGPDAVSFSNLTPTVLERLLCLVGIWLLTEGLSMSVRAVKNIAQRTTRKPVGGQIAATCQMSPTPRCPLCALPADSLDSLRVVDPG